MGSTKKKFKTTSTGGKKDRRSILKCVLPRGTEGAHIDQKEFDRRKKKSHNSIEERWGYGEGTWLVVLDPLLEARA